MTSMRAYLLSVVSAAIVCAIVGKLVDRKGAYSRIIQLLTGIFLSITVVSPLTKITFTELDAYFSQLQVDANSATQDGEDAAYLATFEIIKENTEAYILDKAKNIGAHIRVEVHLSENTPPIPSAVTISGTVAPYAKMQLQNIIENDLAISKENQHWT